MVAQIMRLISCVRFILFKIAKKIPRTSERSAPLTQSGFSFEHSLNILWVSRRPIPTVPEKCPTSEQVLHNTSTNFRINLSKTSGFAPECYMYV